ncbi:hypothetical protein [Bacillus alkalicellulosilyticus]|uniref:hypothetical protein n=1 Tax=Alkalihalobacterium alkalicellulosilyticum TaxID=1912214 RepID=UPI00099812F5|nr:hypothetical protein [Bacillus alkalicellulosilyticus]
MEVLELINQKYDVKITKWKENDVIETDKGLKRVRFWNEYSLLQWHVSWRDECSINPYLITDKMIRTKSNQTEVEYNKGWFTLHDEVTTLSPMIEEEQKWGQLLAKVLNYGLHSSYGEEITSCSFPSLDKYEPLANTFKNFTKDTQKIIYTCFDEAKSRVAKAQYIRKRNKDVTAPLLDSISSLYQARTHNRVLFWQGTMAKPERGYTQFCGFIKEWKRIHGEASLTQVLNEINRSFEMKKNGQLELLLADFLLPWELVELLDSAQHCQSIEECQANYEVFRARWNENQEMIRFLLEWHNEGKANRT